MKHPRKTVLAILSAVVVTIFILFAAVVAWRAYTPDGMINPRFAILLMLVKYDPLNSKDDMQTIREREMKGGSIARGKPPLVAEVRNFEIPSKEANIRVRLYHPQPGKKLPLIIYFHGGGWVLGSLDTHDNVCRQMAIETPSAVLSVDYRLAPEHVFPTAVDDSWNALVWAKEHASEIGTDPDSIAVMGDSAGGNLAAITAQQANGVISLKAQILIYPATDLSNTDRDSYNRFDKGFFLSKGVMEKYISVYTPNFAERKLPKASPLLATDLYGLAPAYLITAMFDVLRDEGELYAAKMSSFGVEVRHERVPGMLHGFIAMDNIIPEARFYISKCSKYAAEKFYGKKY
jgi:acetyl esterase